MINHFYGNIFQLKLSIYFKRPNEQFYRILMGIVNVTIDVCDVLGGKSQLQVPALVLEELRVHTNFFRPCPITVRQHTICLVLDTHQYTIILIKNEW